VNLADHLNSTPKADHVEDAQKAGKGGKSGLFGLFSSKK
jgi:hypothetical protein